MATASTSQPAFETNKCGSFTGKSPDTSLMWDRFVQEYLVNRVSNQLEPELETGPNHIRLCGLKRWKVGKEEPKGSAMSIEPFLHLRALIKDHVNEPFPIQDLVDLKYLHAAEEFLKDWPDFENYIDQVPITDPAVDVDSLGLFAGAKMMQNQVLLDAYLDVPQDEAESFDDSISETPLKKGSYNAGFYRKPPDNDAADEQIVNESLISFASALTRRWMIERTAASPSGADQTPSKGARATPTHDWRTIADWTMSRDRYYIQERLRDNDPTQDRHTAGLRATAKYTGAIVRKADGTSYGRVLTSETDGSLYRIGQNSIETLAIVECKKRMRRKNKAKIEWQEAAEIAAWLNLRLRTESEDRKLKGGGGLPPRRGVLKPKPAYKSSAEKSRCLLLAQDREEIHIVIGEWDAMYEQYILEGKLSKTNIERLDQLRAAKDLAVLDAGFITMHVYGPFAGFAQSSRDRRDNMRTLSTNLLALSLYLSQASCSPLSRRNSPPGSIQVPPQLGEPCCPGCTCGCGCGPPPGGPGTFEPPPGPPRPPSETSETRKGGQQGPREGSATRDPSNKTPSIPSSRSSSSGRPDPTPSRAPRPGGRRPDEIRAGSAHARDAQQDLGTVQAQGHGNLPVRGRPATSGQRGARSESQEQASRSRSRARAADAAAAAGHQGQGPAHVAASRHPPVPQVPGQQRLPQQQQGLRDPRGQQGGQGTQPQRDPRHAATSSATAQHQGGTAYDLTQQRPQTRAQTAGRHAQQSHHDPSSEPGPSHPAQAGPSSRHTPARPAALNVAGPSQQNPGDRPIKPDKKNPLSPRRFIDKIIKDKKDKKGKGPDDDNDGGGGGKR